MPRLDKQLDSLVNNPDMSIFIQGIAAFLSQGSIDVSEMHSRIRSYLEKHMGETSRAVEQSVKGEIDKVVDRLQREGATGTTIRTGNVGTGDGGIAEIESQDVETSRKKGAARQTRKVFSRSGSELSAGHVATAIEEKVIPKNANFRGLQKIAKAAGLSAGGNAVQIMERLNGAGFTTEAATAAPKAPATPAQAARPRIPLAATGSGGAIVPVDPEGLNQRVTQQARENVVQERGTSRAQITRAQREAGQAAEAQRAALTEQRAARRARGRTLRLQAEAREAGATVTSGRSNRGITRSPSEQRARDKAADHLRALKKLKNDVPGKVKLWTKALRFLGPAATAYTVFEILNSFISERQGERDQQVFQSLGMNPLIQQQAMMSRLGDQERLTRQALAGAEAERMAELEGILGAEDFDALSGAATPMVDPAAILGIQ